VTTTGTLGVGYDTPRLGRRLAKAAGDLLLDDAGTSAAVVPLSLTRSRTRRCRSRDRMGPNLSPGT
jgi:hypothetical protein